MIGHSPITPERLASYAIVHRTVSTYDSYALRMTDGVVNGDSPFFFTAIAFDPTAPDLLVAAAGAALYFFDVAHNPPKLLKTVAFFRKRQDSDLYKGEAADPNAITNISSIIICRERGIGVTSEAIKSTTCYKYHNFTIFFTMTERPYTLYYVKMSYAGLAPSCVVPLELKHPIVSLHTQMIPYVSSPGDILPYIIVASTTSVLLLDGPSLSRLEEGKSCTYDVINFKGTVSVSTTNTPFLFYVAEGLHIWALKAETLSQNAQKNTYNIVGHVELNAPCPLPLDPATSYIQDTLCSHDGTKLALLTSNGVIVLRTELFGLYGNKRATGSPQTSQLFLKFPRFHSNMYTAASIDVINSANNSIPAAGDAQPHYTIENTVTIPSMKSSEGVVDFCNMFSFVLRQQMEWDSSDGVLFLSSLNGFGLSVYWMVDEAFTAGTRVSEGAIWRPIGCDDYEMSYVTNRRTALCFIPGTSVIVSTLNNMLLFYSD